MDRIEEVLIVSGGRVSRPLLSSVYETHPSIYIIGVDKGLEALEDLSITPDLALGDFDSASGEIKSKYQDKENTILLSPMKDYTDTHVAVEYALKLNPKKVLILGATGSRLDHVMANFSALLLCVNQGVDAVILDETNRIRLINRKLRIAKHDQYGKYISLIPFSDKVTGVTLVGFVYGLKDAILTKDNMIGISNEIREEESLITIEDGYLIVMETKD